MPADEAAPTARQAAQHALEIDSTLAEAETSLATVKFNYDWDWAGAEQGYQRAIQLNPSYATAYQRYSLLLTAMRRFPEGFRQINKAREFIPLSFSINFSLGWRLYLARQYDRAIVQQALSFLEKAFADRSNGLIFMGVEPELDPIRSDPKFIKLERQLKLPI